MNGKEPKTKKIVRDARHTLGRLDHTGLQSQEGKDSLVKHILRLSRRNLHLLIIITIVLLALSSLRLRKCCRDAPTLSLNGFKRTLSY